MDHTDQERADLQSRRQQDQAFQAALLRAVAAGRERVGRVPAASTTPGDAQTPQAALAAQRDAKWSGT